MRARLIEDAVTDRVLGIRQIATDAPAEGILLSHPSDLRWACGFSGSNGLLLVTSSSADFLTDGRYREQAEKEVSGARVHVVGRSLVEALTGLTSGLQGRRILVQADRTPLHVFLEVKSRMPSVEWIPEDRLLDGIRARKTSPELDAIRAAQSLTEQVFDDVLPLIVPGLSERELSAEIVYRCLRGGAEAMAFDPIVASGQNGALPHARPSTRRLEKGDLVVLDFGCVVEGYASDMTRTVSLGKPDSEALKIHAALVASMEAAIGQIAAGRCAVELDQAARAVLQEAGYAEFFSHGLGHGVGLQVHEWPRVGPGSEDLLPEDGVITIEPGVYLPGRFGIRIEDLVLVRKRDAEVLTRVARQLTAV